MLCVPGADEENDDPGLQERLEAALAQCVFCLYGVDLPWRDEHWGSGSFEARPTIFRRLRFHEVIPASGVAALCNRRHTTSGFHDFCWRTVTPVLRLRS